MMSSRPFSPQDFGAIRIRNNRFRRHRESWNPLWGIFCLTSVSTMVACGFLWWLSKPAPGDTSVGAVDHAAAKNHVAADQGPSANRIDSKRANRPSPSESDRGSMRVPQVIMPAALGVVTRSHDERADQRPSLAEIFESSDPVHGHNSVDDEVFRNLFSLGIKPAKRCSDEAFLRRVYIDTLGTLPTAYEAKSFLDDHRDGKRKALIDQLLDRPEFADYWAMKWCDVLRVKAEFPINLWPQGAQAYHRWIHNTIKQNLPYDQFARELLTSSGSNFRTPQVNFYRAMQSKQPEAIASVVALTFLCERAEGWPEHQLAGMAQFFGHVGYKPTGEWKEEIIYYDSRRGDHGVNQPVTATYPNGVSVIIPRGQDPRKVFATWLTNKSNPWFARAITNRIWHWLIGRGIVHPPDDVRKDNPPTNLRLLDHLADELLAADFDLKHLYRLILNSSAYQLSCVRQTEDTRAGDHFAFYRIQRLDAEVLIDAICQITGTTETYMSIIPEPFTFLPDHQRAISLPDGSITNSFLEMFGRPARDTGLLSERNNRLTASQALHLLNSNQIKNKLARGPGIRELMEQGRDSWERAELIYLAILSRRPTEKELNSAGRLCDDSRGTRDLAWALVNSDEFLFRH